jgi:hypothetical protein
MKALTLIAIALLAVAGTAACATTSSPSTGTTPVALDSTVREGTAGGTATTSPVRVGPPLTSPPATYTAHHVLTEADGGVTVRLLSGQSVNVVLAPNRISQWHVPIASGAALRSVSSSGGYPGEEPARATFLAVRQGEAILHADTDAACLHAQLPCGMPQTRWQVTVIVTG